MTGDQEYPILQSTQQKILTFWQLKFNSFLTEETMRMKSRLDFTLNRMMNTMIIQLRAKVLQDPDAHQKVVLRFEEYPRYETWRAHLVDSLPTGSFRRRFLSRLWGFADDEVLGKKVIHEVVAERRLIFPHATIDVDYPEELGPPAYIYGVRHRYPEEEE
jgi:hypothetical protein